MNDRIKVAVGVIYNSSRDKVLISRRKEGQHLAGYWEFPGGKILPGAAEHQRVTVIIPCTSGDLDGEVHLNSRVLAFSNGFHVMSSRAEC